MANIVVSQEQGRVPVTIFRLKDTAATEEALQTQAEEAFKAGMQNLLLDLTDVPYISSSGLRALHHVYMLLRSPEEDDQAVRKGIAAGTYKSTHLKLLNPSKNVLKALNVSGFDMFLEIYTDLAEAVASF